jgi:soluble lytic murein transglycosylase
MTPSAPAMTNRLDRAVRVSVVAFALSAMTVLGSGVVDSGPAAEVGVLEPSTLESCGSAAVCFSAAAWPKERLGNVLTKDQVAALKLERFRRVMEQFPASLWAKRAGLLSGVMLLERNPAAAMQYLRAAQRDFPVLDDYVRFWMGEALLHLGDAKEAAVLFESVAQVVPDTNLMRLITLQAGEAWYQASSCLEAVPWLVKAVTVNEKEPRMAQAWLRLAACYLRDNQLTEGREALTRLWVQFPQSKEAREAETLLRTNLGGEPWAPLPEDHYLRAQAYLGQALHAEAVEELNTFLAGDPASMHRAEAKLKLGVAQVRLKLYDQARETFQELVAEHVGQSGDATVWLARVYLRQDLGAKLLDLSRSLPKRSLSPERKGQINLFAGIWLEDQSRFDEAIAKYRLVAKSGEPASQRMEAHWREGWVLYRTARYREAIDVWQHILGQRGSEFEPQALYWMARSYGQTGSQKARELFAHLCDRYPYTYYCQLAREQAAIPPAKGGIEDAPALDTSSAPSASGEPVPFSFHTRSEIEQQPAYRRAVELKTLGLDQDAARELAVLTDRYNGDLDILMSLSVMLNEAGAYHHALRLARARFREKLERTGGVLAPGLWSVAYPTGLIPTIKTQGADEVDPLLVAAIIREESQYDWRAVSRVGAIGLMQVMPATAKAVAERHRLPTVGRDDLFDPETNIRIGARYVEQLLAQFSGNVVQTIAAYNAGPMAVRKWSTAHGGRGQDEFVELIPFQETRQYVKRVLRSYKEYVRLARSKPIS